MALTFAYTILLNESSIGAFIPVGDGARVIGFPGSNTFNLEPGAPVDFNGGFVDDIINISEPDSLQASLEGTTLVITGSDGQNRIPVPASGDASGVQLYGVAADNRIVISDYLEDEIAFPEDADSTGHVR